MPNPCDGLYKTYVKAFYADKAADLALASAQDSLTSARINYSGALAAAALCALTIETGPGFFICEAGAYLAAKSAEAAIASAEKAIAADKIVADQTQKDVDAALKAYCDCVNK